MGPKMPHRGPAPRGRSSGSLALLLLFTYFSPSLYSFVGVQSWRRDVATRTFAAKAAKAGAAEDGEDLQKLTVAELKEKLKAKGLPVSGKKAELIERLQGGQSAQEAPPPSAAAPAKKTKAAPAPQPAPEPEPEPEEKPKAAKSRPVKAAKAEPEPEPEEKPVAVPRQPAAVPEPKAPAKAAKEPAESNGTPIISGDEVFIKARTGKYLLYEKHRDDLRARSEAKGDRERFVVEKPGGGAILAGDTVFLKVWTGINVDFVGSAVRARWSDKGDFQQIRIMKEGGPGPVRTGDTIFLKGHQGNVLDVEGENVKCRWPDEGKWQRLTIEK